MLRRSLHVVPAMERRRQSERLLEELSHLDELWRACLLVQPEHAPEHRAQAMKTAVLVLAPEAPARRRHAAAVVGLEGRHLVRKVRLRLVIVRRELDVLALDAVRLHHLGDCLRDALARVASRQVLQRKGDERAVLANERVCLAVAAQPPRTKES